MYDLCDLLAASPATIRRDIVKPQEQRILRKVHGGAARQVDDAHGAVRGKPHRENQVLSVAQKQSIAPAAAELCHNGDTFFIHAGLTCSLFCRGLALPQFVWRHHPETG